MSNNTEQNRIFLCDCHICMRGGREGPKSVSRRTYNNHTPHRRQARISSYADYQSQQHRASHPEDDPHTAPSMAMAESIRCSEPPVHSPVEDQDHIQHKRARIGGIQHDADDGLERVGDARDIENELEGMGNGDYGEDIQVRNRSNSPVYDEIPQLRFDDNDNQDEEDPPVDPGSLADLRVASPEPLNPGQPENDGGNLPPASPQRPSQHIDIHIEEEPEVEATLEDLHIAQRFIEAIRGASLNHEDKSPDEIALIERMKEPRQEILDFDDEEALRTGLELFLSTENASEEVFNNCRATFNRSMQRQGILDHPGIPSLFQLKEHIKEITGVSSIKYDMCIGSCLAYTGPFKDLESCPKCGVSRYDPDLLAATNSAKKKPQRQFHTIPIGPQLQALWRTPQGAASMQYRRNKTEEVRQKAAQNGGQISLDEWDDIFHGTAYLDGVASGKIKDDDMVLLMSIDGAQLYESKQSDCWIYIWVLLDLPPDQRYKKRRIFPGGFIPGPSKPKNVDSFLYPGFAHVAAIMKEGLPIWSALEDRLFRSMIHVILGTADGPGLTYLNGLTGHSGAYGCRLYCAVKGRRKEGGNHYYPALLKPENYHVDGCNHDDVNASHLPIGSPTDYREALNRVLESRTIAQHQQNRKATGISKPSIFSAFPPDRTLSVPNCFGADLMHLISLNIPDLLLDLWRGTLECDIADDKTTWTWAVFMDLSLWKQHGQSVADATPYLPGSFDRPPRNPADKISSGYKAWEFLTYIFGLGPGLLHGVLPDVYFENFCKLVMGNFTTNEKLVAYISADKAFILFFISDPKYRALDLVSFTHNGHWREQLGT
ncbi:hypothetical protein BDN70DRAFT_998988 [Pholiota conissans]|uniref:Transposase family Tnp2 protein n=1 Tax=Pholiota conissans TaxID=109636 RepID=A0A9P6CQJ1_9AGAR|nr:hypothetical protein BDN70DRAFT_998988 [Pholiota conissans]